MQSNFRKNNKKVYTLILIPGKYGKSNTVNISLWCISFFCSIILISAFLSIHLVHKYIQVSQNVSAYKENIQNQRYTIGNQQNEIDKLKYQEADVQAKLGEINSLEKLLKKRVKTSLEDSNSISINSKNSMFLASADYELTKGYSLLDKLDALNTANSKIPHMLPYWVNN